MPTFQVDFHAGQPRAIPTFRCRLVEEPDDDDDHFVDALDAVDQDVPKEATLRALVEATNRDEALFEIREVFESVCILDGPNDVTLQTYRVTFAGSEPRWIPRFPLRCVGTLLDNAMPRPVMEATVEAPTPAEAMAWVRPCFTDVIHYKTVVVADDPLHKGSHTYDVTFRANAPVTAPWFHFRLLPLQPRDGDRLLRAFVPADDEITARKVLGEVFGPYSLLAGPTRVQLLWHRVVFRGVGPRWDPPFRCRRIQIDRPGPSFEAVVEAVDCTDAEERVSWCFDTFEAYETHQDDQAPQVSFWW